MLANNMNAIQSLFLMMYNDVDHEIIKHSLNLEDKELDAYFKIVKNKENIYTLTDSYEYYLKSLTNHARVSKESPSFKQGYLVSIILGGHINKSILAELRMKELPELNYQLKSIVQKRLFEYARELFIIGCPTLEIRDLMGYKRIETVENESDCFLLDMRKTNIEAIRTLDESELSKLSVKNMDIIMKYIRDVKSELPKVNRENIITSIPVHIWVKATYQKKNAFGGPLLSWQKK